MTKNGWAEYREPDDAAVSGELPQRCPPILWLAPDGRVAAVNDAFRRAAAPLAGEPVGQHHDALFRPSEQGRLPWERLMAGEAVIWRGVTAGAETDTETEGRSRAVLSQYLPLRDEAGRVTAIAQFPGFTPVAPPTVPPREDAVEARLRAMLDLAPNSAALLDARLTIRHANPALGRLLAVAPAALAGRGLAALLDDGAGGLGDEERGGPAGDGDAVVELERRIRRQGEGDLWVRIQISPVLSPDASGFRIAQFQDVTEQRQILQMKSNFVATVSHELRTPLTSIKGALGLVLGTSGAELSAKAARLLAIAAKNCDRLALLVNDILDMEKISSGQARFHPKEAPIRGLLEQAEAINQPFGREHGVAFTRVMPPPDAWVRVDEDRFQQVMSNLLSNAAKFSPRGSVVTIGCRLQDGHARITVTDRGPGVPEQFSTRIFMPFSQADDSLTRTTGGTGLGLNISRQIVERMGGEIGFENHAEGGCTFWVQLPEITPTAAAEREIEPVGDGSRRPLVLHVDHDRDFAEVLRIGFAGRAVVSHAVTLAEAAWYARQSHFDLILIDWDGIRSGGVDLLNVFEQMQPGVPVYGLSTRDNATDARVRRNLIKGRMPIDQLVGAFTGGRPDPAGLRAAVA